MADQIFASLGQVHTVFTDLVEGQALAAAVNAAAALGNDQRQWLDPPGAWTAGPFDLSAVHSAFDRASIAANYNEVLTSVPPGSLGDEQSLRLQNEYVATGHRAYLTRHVSPVRAALHAASRLQGHGSSLGVLRRGTAGAAQWPITLGKPPTDP